MVVAAFPLAKIGLLLMKQLSKPLANIIKNRAKKHPTIRQYVIFPIGKAYHYMEFRALQVKKDEKMAKLPPEEVIELGSNAIGEIILFGLLTIILLAEYNRQGDKKAVKQKIKDDEMMNLVMTVLDMTEEIRQLKLKVKKIEGNLKPLDAIESEYERHPAVYDNDFLDVMLGAKRKFWRKDKEIRDSESPSP